MLECLAHDYMGVMVFLSQYNGELFIHHGIWLLLVFYLGIEALFLWCLSIYELFGQPSYKDPGIMVQCYT